MSDRRIGGVVMNDAPPIAFPPPHRRSRDEPHINAPGMLERIVRRPSEPADPPGPDDGDS
jgi:hypothetical protein